jgi:homoserine O-acetyltransferase/O-succinyltransferase
MAVDSNVNLEQTASAFGRKVRNIVVVSAMTLLGLAPLAIGQGNQTAGATSGPVATPGPHQDNPSFANYKFRDGETLPEFRLHYMTLGNPHKNAQGAVDNAILFLHWTNAGGQSLSGDEFQKALFAAGAPLDASRYFIIIPDDIGHGKSSKPSDGLKAGFPHYGYGDMVDLQHKLAIFAQSLEKV